VGKREGKRGKGGRSQERKRKAGNRVVFYSNNEKTDCGAGKKRFGKGRRARIHKREGVSQKYSTYEWKIFPVVPDQSPQIANNKKRGRSWKGAPMQLRESKARRTG